MSDRRSFSFHRAAKAAYQGRHVRDALRRLHQQARQPWPRATAPTPAPSHTPTANPAPAPTRGAGTTAQKEP